MIQKKFILLPALSENANAGEIGETPWKSHAIGD
jgi:hypothetical protein